MDSMLGQNIKRLREKRGWSQVDLARRAGTKDIAMIESGRRPNARWDTIVKIAAALGVRPETLHATPRRRRATA